MERCPACKHVVEPVVRAVALGNKHPLATPGQEMTTADCCPNCGEVLRVHPS